jgi:hypothetical protein
MRIISSPPAGVNPRTELARFGAALDGRGHWVIGTDDPAAAVATRLLAVHCDVAHGPTDDILLLETAVLRVGDRDALRLTALALPKSMLSRDQVVEAFAWIARTAGSNRPPPATAADPDVDQYLVARDLERLCNALEGIRLGAISPFNPNAN